MAGWLVLKKKKKEEEEKKKKKGAQERRNGWEGVGEQCSIGIWRESTGIIFKLARFI